MLCRFAVIAKIICRKAKRDVLIGKIIKHLVLIRNFAYMARILPSNKQIEGLGGFSRSAGDFCSINRNLLLFLGFILCIRCNR